MVRSQATTMKTRNKNGRIHAAFSALDLALVVADRIGSLNGNQAEILSPPPVALRDADQSA